MKKIKMNKENLKNKFGLDKGYYLLLLAILEIPEETDEN